MLKSETVQRYCVGHLACPETPHGAWRHCSQPPFPSCDPGVMLTSCERRTSPEHRYSSRTVWPSQALTHPICLEPSSERPPADEGGEGNTDKPSSQRDASALQTSDLQNSSPETTHRGRCKISWVFLLLFFFLFLPFLCHDTHFVLNILNILIFKKY